MFQRAELLTADQLQELHAASLEILAQVGMLVHNPAARERLARHGCLLDGETQIVRFPPAVVREFTSDLPRRFTFRGRDPRFDRTAPGDGPLAATASSAPDILDPETGRIRRAVAADIGRIGALVNRLAGYDIYGVSVTADDAPAGKTTLARLVPALMQCAKPVRCSAPSLDELDQVLQLGTLVAGSEAAFWARPPLTLIYCAVVSPLTLDVDSTAKLMLFAERGIPSFGVIAPNAGMTSPLSLMGTLAQCNAEFLAQTVLVQMSRRGTPTVYSVLPTVADMRRGVYAPGGIENGILTMACAQMATFYGVPSESYIGLTNAKSNDAQAGYEAGMSVLAAALAGTDILTMGCLLDSLMVFDYASAIVGDEIARMAKQVVRGIPPGREQLAVETMAAVGPGGTFIDQTHTLRHIRDTGLIPVIADRAPRADWELAGRPSAEQRALRRAQQLLASDNPNVCSPEVEAGIRQAFGDLPSLCTF